MDCRDGTMGPRPALANWSLMQGFGIAESLLRWVVGREKTSRGKKDRVSDGLSLRVLVMTYSL